MDYKVGDKVYFPTLASLGSWDHHYQQDLVIDKCYIINCLGEYNFALSNDVCVGLEGTGAGWVPVKAIRPWSEHPSKKLGWYRKGSDLTYRKIVKINLIDDKADYHGRISDGIYYDNEDYLNKFHLWHKVEDLSEIQQYLPDGHPDKLKTPIPVDIVAEAKEKYPVGTKYKCPIALTIREITEEDLFYLGGESVFVSRGGNAYAKIYCERNKKWSEIIESNTGTLTKEQLVEEAKKRGYVPGAQFLDLVHNAKFTIDSVGEFQNFKDPTQLYVAVKHNTLGNKTARIYKKGVWSKLLTNSVPIQAQKADEVLGQGIGSIKSMMEYPITPSEVYSWNPKVGDYATYKGTYNSYWTNLTFKIARLHVTKLGTFLYNGDGEANVEVVDCRPATSAEVLKVAPPNILVHNPELEWKWEMPKPINILEEDQENVMDTSVKRIQALTTHLVEETETIYF